MSTNARHIVCPHCNATNRVPPDKPAAKGRCGRCRQPLFTGHPVAATSDSLAKHIQHDAIPVLVDFWAAWCGPCRAMAPVYESAAAEFEPEVRFLKVDTEAERDLAARYNIRSIPTLMLFRNGTVIDQQAGALDGQTLRAWLRRHTPQAARASQSR